MRLPESCNSQPASSRPRPSSRGGPGDHQSQRLCVADPLFRGGFGSPRLRETPVPARGCGLPYWPVRLDTQPRVCGGGEGTTARMIPCGIAACGPTGCGVRPAATVRRRFHHRLPMSQTVTIRSPARSSLRIPGSSFPRRASAISASPRSPDHDPLAFQASAAKPQVNCVTYWCRAVNGRATTPARRGGGSGSDANMTSWTNSPRAPMA